MKGAITERDTESERLEALWAGAFGDSYTARNALAGEGRDAFWNSLLEKYGIATVLEVGCNVGTNLQWIAQALPPRDVFGVDLNEDALADLRRRLPRVNAAWSLARSLPFRDRWFDLVFTAGVLIHVPERPLLDVMKEIVRCSRRYVLCLEYYAEETTPISYRGEEAALFKRDYGRIYAELDPELELVDRGELGREQGWDDVTWWLFER